MGDQWLSPNPSQSQSQNAVKSLETCETSSFLPAQTAPTKPTQSEAHGEEGLTTSTTHWNCLWATFCQSCDSASIIHRFIHSRCWSSTSLCFCINFLWLTELCVYKPQCSVVKEKLSLRGILTFNGDKVATFTSLSRQGRKKKERVIMSNNKSKGSVCSFKVGKNNFFILWRDQATLKIGQGHPNMPQTKLNRSYQNFTHIYTLARDKTFKDITCLWRHHWFLLCQSRKWFTSE